MQACSSLDVLICYRHTRALSGFGSWVERWGPTYVCVCVCVRVCVRWCVEVADMTLHDNN